MFKLKYTLLPAAAAALLIAALSYRGPVPPADLRDAPRDSAPAGKIDQAFSALAAETGVSGDTHYELLRELYRRGEEASPEDVTGWFYTLVARDKEKSFFGIGGGLPRDDGEPGIRRVSEIGLILDEGFNLETPIPAEWIESLRQEARRSAIVLSFPPGKYHRKNFTVSVRKFGKFVISKHSGPKMKDAAPPFDSGTFYSCYVKRINHPL